jgi:hypothetical protein
MSKAFGYKISDSLKSLVNGILLSSAVFERPNLLY